MAHCDEYLELISAAVDGALSPSELERLNAHLALCPECKALYQDLTAIHAALRDLPPVEVPADLPDRIMAAVAAEKVLPFAPAEKKKSSAHWQRWLASAAVLAVVVAGAWGWKPWERIAGDLEPEEVNPTAVQNFSPSDMTKALPEASEGPVVISAEPDGAEIIAYHESSGVSAAAAVPDPTAQPRSVGGEGPAAKTGGESQAALPAGSISTEAPEVLDAYPPRTAVRMMPELDSVEVEKEAALPTAAPEETAPPVVQPNIMMSSLPSEAAGDVESALTAAAPEETAPPVVQPNIMMSSLPLDRADAGEALTAREALERLVAYIFEYSGYDSVEYVSQGEELSAQVTAQGCGGMLSLLLQQEDETLYQFEFYPEIGDETHSYTVSRLTGEITSLSGE